MPQAPIQQPIFVVGTARSGTTFLGEVLKRTPGVHCLMEKPEVFSYATYLGMHPEAKRADPAGVRRELRERYERAWALRPFSCRSCIPECRDAGGIQGRAPWRRCEDPDAVRWYADKSHQLLLSMDVVLGAFPDARFVHIVRDGRDVVASMLRHEGVRGWFDVIDPAAGWPQPWYGLESEAHYRDWRSWSDARRSGLRWAAWVRAAREGSRGLPPDRWIDLRYEELVTDPQRVAADVCARLGLPFHAAAVGRAHASSVGGWRDKLSARELEDALTEMGATLRETGYAD